MVDATASKQTFWNKGCLVVFQKQAVKNWEELEKFSYGWPLFTCGPCHSVHTYLVPCINIPFFHNFRGCPAGGLGGRCENAKPMVDPHTTEILLCGSRLIWGETSLDRTHGGLSVQTSAERQPQARIHLCCCLDPRPGLCHLHALLWQVHRDPASTPLPKMWLCGLWCMFQEASSDQPHSPD